MQVVKRIVYGLHVSEQERSTRLTKHSPGEFRPTSLRREECTGEGATVGRLYRVKDGLLGSAGRGGRGMVGEEESMWNGGVGA